MAERHCVRFFIKGKPNATRDLRDGEADPAAITLPEDAYGFQYFDMPGLLDDPAHDRDARRDMFKSQRYLFGDVFTLNDVLDGLPGETGLARRMRFNGWSHVLRTQGGDFLPLESGDVVLGNDRQVKFREDRATTVHPDNTMNRIIRKAGFKKLGN